MTSGMTALMLASQNNDAEMVKILLKGGADVKIKNSSGKTARDLATSDTVKELLNPNKKIILASVIGVLVFVILLVVLLRGKKNSKYKLLNAIKAAKYDKAISLINKGSNLELKDAKWIDASFLFNKRKSCGISKGINK
jgi:Ankyrin repeat.